MENIHKARELRPKKTEEKKLHSFKVNHLVLVKDPDSAVFKPRFQPNYRVTAIFLDNQIEILQKYGAKDIPNLGFQLKSSQEANEDEEHLLKLLEGAGDAVQVMVCNVLLRNPRRNTTYSPQYSEVSKQSINSLSSVVHEVVHQLLHICLDSQLSTQVCK